MDASDMLFNKVNESYRTYYYPDGTFITIDETRIIGVRPSGYHMVEDNRGIKHLIAPGWNHISFEGDWAF